VNLRVKHYLYIKYVFCFYKPEDIIEGKEKRSLRKKKWENNKENISTPMKKPT